MSNWTKSAPTLPGYYWVLWIEDDPQPDVVYVYDAIAGPRVENEEHVRGVSHPDELPVWAWWPEPLPTPWRES